MVSFSLALTVLAWKDQPAQFISFLFTLVLVVLSNLMIELLNFPDWAVSSPDLVTPFLSTVVAHFADWDA